MSGVYTVLARKWRPRTFAEVVGQDVIVRTLTNAIRRDRVAHAYLFAGSRGTGKTTVARILARALNCEKGPTPEPCGECTSCLEILRGTSIDVMEIDGASTRGIDDVRRLREDVKLVSGGSRKKVYIVDEVHMLTPQAFNALLKTLEEPPPHVVFVLATTDPQKLPDTILSRCQRYNFARIPVADIVARLREVVETEGVTLTDGALLVLARRSGGALRDALGFLDQIIATGVSPIDEAAVVEALGLVGSDVYTDLVKAFLARDPKRALEIAWDIQRGGYDLEFFVQGVLDVLRNLLVLVSAPGADEILEVSDEERAVLHGLAKELPLGDLLRLVRIAVEVGDLIRKSDYPWIHLEVSLVEMASLDRVQDLNDLIVELRRSAVGESKASPRQSPLSAPLAPKASPPAGIAGSAASFGSGSSAGSEPSETPAGPAKRAAPSRGKPRDASASAAGTTVISAQALEEIDAESWGRVLDEVKAQKPLLWSILTQGEPGGIAGDVFRFRLDPGNGFHLEQLREPAHLDLIQQCISSVCHRPLRVELALEAGAGAAAPGNPDRRRVLEDPFVKKLLEAFDGEVVE